MLPPAVLHYGRDQIIWECNTGCLCSETGERSYGSVLRLSKITDATVSFSRERLWGWIVSNYTSRSITYNSERLLAILGVLSRLRLEKFYNSRIVAGLWEENLSRELLWFTPRKKDITCGGILQPNTNVELGTLEHKRVHVQHNS